jgi:hypothetical protein
VIIGFRRKSKFGRKGQALAIVANAYLENYLCGAAEVVSAAMVMYREWYQESVRFSPHFRKLNY